MHPWLFTHPPIPTYGVFLLLAVVASWLLARFQARRTLSHSILRLHPSHLDLMLPIVVAAALLGAWLFGLATDALLGSALSATPSSHVLLGALLTATAAGIVYALLAHIPLGLMGDVLAPALPLGIAIGRLGCYMAGCCYGRICSSPTVLTAATFPRSSPAYNDQVARGLIAPDSLAASPVYPVQLYEALLCALLAAVLVAEFNRRRISGELFLRMALGYAVVRFGLEFIRGDNPPVALGLTFSQFLCAGVFAVALITLVARRHWADRLDLRCGS